MARRQGEKLVADNRRARHEFELLERIEAGLVLQGTEVKALREGRATIERAFADVRGNEIWLVGANIAAYDKGGFANHDPERDRKLLLHRREGELHDKRRDIAKREADRQIERALKSRHR